jgi:hypothetical protein
MATPGNGGFGGGRGQVSGFAASGLGPPYSGTGGGGAGMGGAIFLDSGSLALIYSVLSNNAAYGGYDGGSGLGGGIFVRSGTVATDRCTFADNHARSWGAPSGGGGLFMDRVALVSAEAYTTRPA